MKKNFTLLFMCLTLTVSFGQDIIYLKDNTIIECALQEVSFEKIKYKKLDNLEGPNFSVRKENALFTLSKKGYYLVMQELDSSAVNTNATIEKFNKSIKGESIPTDLIFTNKGIFRVNIKDDADPIVYLSTSGLEGKVNASDVIAIIYKDGHHKFIDDIENVAQTIMTYRNTTSLDKSSLVKTSKSSLKIGDSEGDIDLGGSGIVSFDEYSRKAVIKIEKFTDYIKILSTKSIDIQKSNKAIKEAIDLFINENASVEVNNQSSTDKKKYKIREYLNKVKLNKYDKIKIEIQNANIQYVGKPRKGSKGQYYGVVLFEQVFKGLQDEHIIYEERIQKKQNVIIKIKEGNKNLLWDVFLNDIVVEETKI